MNHLRTARRVASATRSLPLGRAYPKPRNLALARFYSSHHNTPRIQPVILHEAREFTWRKFGIFMAFAVPSVFAFEYLSWGLDLIVEVARQSEEDDEDDDDDDAEYYEDDEGSEDGREYDDNDEDDELDLEGSIYIFGFPFGSFLPIPWTRRQLPRDPYPPDAEIRELWNEFKKDKEAVQQYRQQLSEEIMAAAAEIYRNASVRRVGGFLSDIQLPFVPPREYDQLGIVLFGGLPHLERRAAPPLTLFKDAIQSFVFAARATCSFIVRTKTNQVRQYFGLHPVVIPVTEMVEHHNKMIHHLRNIQEQQARAAGKKNAALEKTGDKDAQDAVVPAKSDAARPIVKTMQWSAKHTFVWAFFKDLNRRISISSDIPRDCISVIGTVHLQLRSGDNTRVHLHDFNGFYSLRKRRFVEFHVRRKFHQT